MASYKVLALLGTIPFRDLFCALLCAHLAGDFVLQPDTMVKAKRYYPVLFAHAFIHAALAWILVGEWRLWQLPVAVFLAHAAIDRAKLLAGPKFTPARGFWLDQGLHLLSIIFFALLWANSGLSVWRLNFGPGPVRLMAAAAGFILGVRTAAIAIGQWVQPYLGRIAPEGSDEVKTGSERGLPNGGRIIGQWERAIIFLLIYAGIPSGIGFLIAAKSIFRFGELSNPQNRMEAEYITIGTLMSFGIAIAVGYASLLFARSL